MSIRRIYPAWLKATILSQTDITIIRFLRGMSYIGWSANAVVRNNTFRNTTGNELKGPACWLRGGCATYEVEGNHFIGNTDATGENANQYAPLKIRIGANVSADQTKAYTTKCANYSTDIGKYAEVVRSTPGAAGNDYRTDRLSWKN